MWRLSIYIIALHRAPRPPRQPAIPRCQPPRRSQPHPPQTTSSTPTIRLGNSLHSWPHGRPPSDAPSPRRASAAPLIPTPGHGEQIWILDVPYRASAPGAKYYKALKAYAYIGTQLPDELTVYASKPYSYARWVEEDFNGVRQPGATGFHKIPRPEQVDAAKAIATAFHHGKRGFLLADEPGVGKTGSAILGAKAALKLGGGDTVLITVDRPAQITIAAWRDALAAFGDGGYRWLIISPDQLKKLLGRNGQPKYSFSLIINDEAQQFRHLTAQRTQYQRRINRLSAITREGAVRDHRHGDAGSSPRRIHLLVFAFRATAR